jgi:formate-dependent nitrite reductase membrane component NrfD
MGQKDPLSPLPRKNRLRRFGGVALCLLPVALAAACALWQRSLTEAKVYTGLVLAGVACLVGLLNLQLALVRPRLYRRRHGSLEGCRFVSGLPIVGTFLLVAGCLTAFGSAAVGALQARRLPAGHGRAALVSPHDLE